MQSDVVTVRPDTPVREVARILTESKISGVPVVEESGRIAGVVSSTDLLRLAARRADMQLESLAFPGDWMDMSSTYGNGADDDPDGDDGYSTGAPPPWLAVAGDLDWGNQSDSGDTRVGDVMTSAFFAVDPDATISELAQFLLRGRIHRALVVEDDRLVAIVTSFDVLRAVAAGS